MNIITKPHVKDQYIEPGTVLTEEIINLREMSGLKELKESYFTVRICL